MYWSSHSSQRLLSWTKCTPDDANRVRSLPQMELVRPVPRQENPSSSGQWSAAAWQTRVPEARGTTPNGTRNAAAGHGAMPWRLLRRLRSTRCRQTETSSIWHQPATSPLSSFVTCYNAKVAKISPGAAWRTATRLQCSKNEGSNSTTNMTDNKM